MDRYIGDLISDQRFDTQNEDTDAISSSQFLRYNQYAQHRLYGRITLGFSWLFEETITTAVVADQATYNVEDNLAFGTRITNVEYSETGNTGTWKPLKVTTDRYRDIVTRGRPWEWLRRHGSVVIRPVPDSSTGYLRITYERAMDRLALRVAQINGTPSGTTISTDNIDTTLTSLLTANAFVCVSDINGVPLLYNGIISSWSSPTLTLTANVEDYLETGYSLSDLDNAFITVGKYTTTHSKFPNEAEGYFNEYVNRKINGIEDNDTFDLTEAQLTEQEQMIVAAMKLPDKARKTFPIVDHEMLIPEYE